MKPRRNAGFAAAALAIMAMLAAAPALAGRVETLIVRSRAAAAKGRLDDAVMLMQAAVVADPARAASYVALAGLYARHNKFDFASKYDAEALEIAPTLAPALGGAGEAALALGDRAGAEAMLARLEKSCGADCAETKSLDAALKATQKAAPDTATSLLDKH